MLPFFPSQGLTRGTFSWITLASLVNWSLDVTKNKHMEVTFVAHLSFLKKKTRQHNSFSQESKLPSMSFSRPGISHFILGSTKKKPSTPTVHTKSVSRPRGCRRQNAKTRKRQDWTRESTKTRKRKTYKNGISRQSKQFFTAGTLPLAISWVHGLAKCLWHQGLGCRKPSWKKTP